MRASASHVVGAAVVALLALPLAAVAERATSAPLERPSVRFDPEAFSELDARLHRQLVLEQAEAGLDDPLEIRVGKHARARLARTIEGERPIRVGTKRRVGLSLDFASETQPFGAARVTSDGGFVWTGVVRSPHATALRVELRGVDLPVGHELWVYGPEGQARGPYTGRGPGGSGAFWTHTIFGSELILQLRSPALQEPAARFTLARVGHMGPKFRLPAYARGERADGFTAEAFCSFNESCVENVNCSSPDPAVAAARDAVAQILFPSQGGFFICSGGLMADTDTQTVRELFLTANHCISRGSEAAGSESFFQFEVNCNASCVPFDNGSFPSVAGATILKGGKKADYTLMELAGPAPAGSAYLGWNSADVANANGTALFRISHPGGAPQAYSEHVVDTSAPTCGGWPRGARIYSRDVFGATEGGSSGSPVVNGAGEVVGQLSGACGFNVGDVCDAESNATVDGAFANYFSQVQDILDPGTGGGETCTPGSLPKGSSCTADSQCQSCKCKGPNGNKSCK
ncbi:MAG: serine protease [Thermoanaerobaculia bacterium]|nr:serine protease [Thermoanaerobaculia bacterium]